MGGNVANIADLYEIRTWKGMDQHRCKVCQWDTLKGQEAIIDHIVKTHIAPAPGQVAPRIPIPDRFGNEQQMGQPVDVEVPDVSGMKVDDVIAAVDAGEMTAAEALISESAGRQRKSLVEALEARKD